mmetsp:Transcript_1293/g.4010  ORF Transcript_1293/g.4010 Transcript_1293/m.4010 type:complete len:227 (-) Transcript_1293:48-728(-)
MMSKVAVLAAAAFAAATSAVKVFDPAPVDVEALRERVSNSTIFQEKLQQSCSRASEDQQAACQEQAAPLLFCQLVRRSSDALAAQAGCGAGNVQLLQLGSTVLRGRAPEDDLAQEMTHDLEMNFNKIAPFGKEDTAKELQDHAAKTQDTLVDAVENAEVAEIKRAVFRALTRLRAATIKEFDTIARLETQAIDAYNDAHHYRAENPLAHLHEDEAPVETDKLKSFH